MTDSIDLSTIRLSRPFSFYIIVACLSFDLSANGSHFVSPNSNLLYGSDMSVTC